LIRGVHHVAISTPDADRLLGFYCGLLGSEKLFDGSWEAGTQRADTIMGLKGWAARQIMLRTGNLYLEVFEFRSPTPRAGDPERAVCDHGITHVCLLVDGLDHEYERLQEAGVPFQSSPQDIGGGIRTIYARDPDANIVELKELAYEDHPWAIPA
jgi:glyoxylase I family protein